MPVRDHLLQIQRTLYDRFRTSAQQVGKLNPVLRKYFQEYQREFTDYTEVCSRSELVQAFVASEILVCGDYHTLPQAQRTALRLLAEALEPLQAHGRTPVLALEMLRTSDEAATAAYLAGTLKEAAFLEAIGFHKNWGFAWSNYRPLFEFARENGIRIVGLSPSLGRKRPSLRERDKYAAKVLARQAEAHTDACFLVLMGDLHLAKGHLPAELEKTAKRALRVVVVHQNAEPLYWKLAEQGLEHQADAVRLRPGVYCVMNTPPWVKLQSYLRWVEWTADPDASPDWDKAAYAEDFSEMVRTIQHFIGSAQAVEDGFEIRGPGEWSGIDRKAAPAQKNFRKLLLRSVGSYYRPDTREVLLTSAGVNGAATQAAIYLHASLSRRWKQFTFPKQDFYPTVWFEALGFLGSKIINPHRRCYGPSDFNDARKSDALARWVSNHVAEERKTAFVGPELPARPCAPERTVFFYRAARCLGQMLGAALYAAVAANKVKREELLALFQEPFSDGKKARKAYLEWTRRLDGAGLRDVIRRET